MDPITLIIIVALVILIVWLVTQVPLNEPTRSIAIGILIVALVAAVLKLLGIWNW